MLSRFFRLTLAFSLTFTSTRAVGFSYSDDNYWNVVSVPNYLNNNYFNNFNPQINFTNFSAFNLRSFSAPELNLSLATARLPKFDVKDIGENLWHYNLEPLKFDDNKRVSDFKALIDIPGDHQVTTSLEKIDYQEKSLSPLGFKQIYQDSQGNSLTRVRTNQISEVNPSYKNYQSGVRQYHPELVSNPSLPKPEGLLPPPTQELIRGFDEKWSLPSGEKINLSIDKMNYGESNRYLGHYEGTAQQNGQIISFSIDAKRGDRGEINSVAVKMWGKDTKVTEATWSTKTGVDPDKSFAFFRDHLPVPLLLGPRSTTRLNGVDVPEAPIKITETGDLNKDQLNKPQDMAALFNKTEIGIDLKFSAPDKTTFSHRSTGETLFNGFRNAFYMITGRWSEVKGLRQELTSMRNQSPGKFLLTAGFNDPNFMSIKDLKSAIHDSKPFSIYPMPDGSIVKGQLEVKSGELISMKPGAVRSIPSNGSPIELNGVKWNKGEFIWDGQNYHLKGDGVFSTTKFMNFDLVNSSLKIGATGNGEGNIQTTTIEPISQNTNVIERVSGLKARVQENGNLALLPNQTGTLKIDGQISPIEINEFGNLAHPVKTTLPWEGESKKVEISQLNLNLETGGYQLGGRVFLENDQTLHLSAKSSAGTSFPVDRFTALTKASIHQEGNEYIFSNGSVGFSGLTSHSNETEQSLATLVPQIGEGSRFKVIGPTTFNNVGLEVLVGDIEWTKNGVNLHQGSLYNDKTGTYFLAGGFNEPLKVSLNGDRFISNEVSAVSLTKGESLPIKGLYLEGSIDWNSGSAKLTNKGYEIAGPSSEASLIITVGNNQIESIQTNHHYSIPQPEQSFHVEPDAVEQSYSYAINQFGDSRNTVLQRGSFLGLAILALPASFLEGTITFTRNAQYFMGQSVQYFARITLQDTWQGKVNEGLNSAAFLGMAVMAVLPIADIIAPAANRITQFVVQKLESGIAARFNPLNYSILIEPNRLGLNGGNIQLEFRPQQLSLISHSYTLPIQKIDIAFSFVRKELPQLPESFAQEFEGPIRSRTYHAGERIQRSPWIPQESAENPRRWLGTRETMTKKGTDSMYQISKWKNPNSIARTYEFTRDVTTYYGKVKGGTGHQIFIPIDINPRDILKFIEERKLK